MKTVNSCKQNPHKMSTRGPVLTYLNLLAGNDGVVILENDFQVSLFSTIITTTLQNYQCIPYLQSILYREYSSPKYADDVSVGRWRICVLLYRGSSIIRTSITIILTISIMIHKTFQLQYNSLIIGIRIIMGTIL